MSTRVDYDDEVAVKEEIEVKEPNMWNVILHNDDKTTMDFVVQVLHDIFYMDLQEAMVVMLKIHEEDAAVVGTYTHEIAEEKAQTTIRAARVYGFPLMATIEEDV